MPAYGIARLTVTDPAKYEEYKKLVPAALAAYGVKSLSRGGAIEILEGTPDDRRVIVVEFADMDTARAFYNTPEYQAAKAKREGAAELDFIVVDGVPPSQ